MTQAEFFGASVGYGKNTVVGNIDLQFMQGRMTCILGANGTGKTTILKTLARLIPSLKGRIALSGLEIQKYTNSEFSKKMAVVLTQRLSLENMTGFEVVCMGRHPHTGILGGLSAEDNKFSMEMLLVCNAENLSDKQFSEMSDGEKQKVLIARGLAQNPELLILDEPTSHLDIRYKLDILTHLRHICIAQNKTVICTLHEPDLAIKCADYLVLVDNDHILCAGPTDEIVSLGLIDKLYGLREGQLDSTTGMVEFSANNGKEIFIIGADESTPTLLRRLTRNEIGFAIGVLHSNDVCCHIASSMGAKIIKTPAYSPISSEQVEEAVSLASGYKQIILSDFVHCDLTHGNTLVASRLAFLGQRLLTASEYLATAAAKL